MRIAFVTSIHPDFDARVWKYAVMLARRGHRVHLVCPWAAPDGEARQGVTLHTFRRARSRLARWVLNPWNVAHKLSGLARSVDLIHFHDLDMLPYMAVLALFKPVVYDVHENYPEQMLVREWIPAPLRRALYHAVRFVQAGLSRLIRNVVLVVPDLAKDFPEGRLRTVFVRNYATLDLLASAAADYGERRDTVVFMGSNYEGNGTFLFLEIADRMKSLRPHVRFLMVDRWFHPPTEQRALEIIRQRDLSNVTILPMVLPHNIMEYLNRATIGISPGLRLPSQINALPTKLFEYMAAGLPVVASDMPHAVRLAEETGAVLTCRPEEPESFVAAIERLVDDRDEARRIGQRGQQVFQERYCWESQAGVLEQFYGDILGRRVSVPQGDKGVLAGGSNR